MMASLDHVVPRSRGGKDAWENLGWSSKDVNARKGNRLPPEAGLKLLTVPRALKELQVTALIRNAHGVAEWKLFLNGVETEACLEGRILGTQAKVRVFSVQFIKGLEFEAVFFVGADRMSALTPDLVDRFLYVGLTRACCFLAVTTDCKFPHELAHVKDLFKQATW
jgi:UvrD-like helicase C-terminal domain/HNH endonuclease